MIHIINYGMGNAKSISNMLNKIGHEAWIANSPNELVGAKKLVLPGVGAFDNGMQKLQDLGFREILDELVLGDRLPILGICLGMQLFSNSSEEGSRMGLGWIDAHTIRFSVSGEPYFLKIPHMGWNVVTPVKEDPLLDNLPSDARFYFVHSYHLHCKDSDDILTTSVYGYTFASAIRRNNIMGVQFHPEKSHKFGMHLLKNFAEL